MTVSPKALFLGPLLSSVGPPDPAKEMTMTPVKASTILATVFRLSGVLSNIILKKYA